MGKILITLILILFLCDFGYSQNDDKQFKHCIDSLIHEINNLPKSNIYGFRNQRWQDKYYARWNNWSNKLIIKDFKYNPLTNLSCEDHYKSTIDFSDLHSEGVFLKYSEDSSNISLMLFTAGNLEKIQHKSYLRGFLQSRDYSDRYSLSNWNKEIALDNLIKIKKLFEESILLKTNWDINDRPDPNGLIPIKIRKRERVINFNYGSFPPYLNATIEFPSLFITAGSEGENSAKVKQYVINELKTKGIKYSGTTVGAIIISDTGKVIDFISANKNSSELELQVKRIILSMPDWIPGKLQNQNVKVSQMVVIN